jgi:hypothetical protein
MSKLIKLNFFVNLTLLPISIKVIHNGGVLNDSGKTRIIFVDYQADLSAPVRDSQI